MKILYALQGTGNGHISRATDIISILKLKGDVDVLISGNIKTESLPFKVDYQLHGLGFVFGKNGGIDILKTIKSIRLKKLIKEIKSLPIKQYDVVINDFEPISAWAGKLKNVSVIALSHQAAVLNKKSPKPKSFNWLEKKILEWYAPAKHHYGFHFSRYDKNIFYPVIRQQIRNKTPRYNNHYTVYLPAYSDKKIIKVLSMFKNIKWHVFSKQSEYTYVANDINIYPISSDKFIESMISCKGVLCGAGFETPAEALFLQKKVLVIPMKNQFEQKCNAAALEKMGIPIIKKLSKKYMQEIKCWLAKSDVLVVDYKDNTAEIVQFIFEKHIYKSTVNKSPKSFVYPKELPIN